MSGGSRWRKAGAWAPSATACTRLGTSRRQELPFDTPGVSGLVVLHLLLLSYGQGLFYSLCAHTFLVAAL